MTTILPGYTHEQYEEALSVFEQAQTIALNTGNIAEGARLANAFANTAHAMGNLAMAERCHRDAIYNYQLEDETERLSRPQEEIVPVRREILGQYALLGAVFGNRSRGLKTEFKLRNLKHEILDTGPVAREDVVAGLWALHVTYDSLGKVGLGYRGINVRRAKHFATLCELASYMDGLGIRALLIGNDDPTPRPMKTWLAAIRAA